LHTVGLTCSAHLRFHVFAGKLDVQVNELATKPTTRASIAARQIALDALLQWRQRRS
jgi:hypothetical protein